MAEAHRVLAIRVALASLILSGLAAAVFVAGRPGGSSGRAPGVTRGRIAAPPAPVVGMKRRQNLDLSGFLAITTNPPDWKPDDSLPEIARAWHQPGMQLMPACERKLEAARRAGDRSGELTFLITKATLWNAEGRPDRGYQELEAARTLAESDAALRPQWLATILYAQGVTALRRGENDNCIDCRGETSCILPIGPAAVHTRPTGSRLAVRHFTELLDAFPDDLEARWLLNLAHMTLGEHPAGVIPRHLIGLDRFVDSELDIGRFRDVGHLVGVEPLQPGGLGDPRGP